MNKNIIAVILIVIGGGIYFTLTSPMIDDARAVKAKNDQLATDLNNAEEVIRTRNEITRQYLGIPEEDRTKLDKMIPSAVDNIRLVIDLDNLAQQKHVSISDVKAVVPSNAGQSVSSSKPSQSAPPAPLLPGSFSGAVSQPVLDKVEISFKAVATYEQFQEFLQAIEKSLRIMDLSRLSLKASDSGNYEFTVQFQTYWLRQ